MMTRKHFNAIAKTFAERMEEIAGDEYLCEQTAILAEHFADVFERDNPNFNRARFLDACGVYG